MERLTYDRAATAVTDRSDKSEGPTAGTETADPLEFLARVLVHIPEKGQVTTRYYGWYANRPGGMRRRAKPAGADPAVPMLVAPTLAPTEATRRWAALLRQLFEVDPLVCPRCAGPMRIVACITQAAVIDQILAHVDGRPRSPCPCTRPEVPACRSPAHGSGPRGVPMRPTSSPRQATTTRRGADWTARRAGGRATAPCGTARGRVAWREALRDSVASAIGSPILTG